MRAAIYARFSTEKQSEASIADQFRVCERLAERHGFEVVARYSDAAISGGTTARPGYQDLLRAARRRAFDVIVSEDISRLWRASAEQEPRLAELADLGIAVVTHDLDTRQEAADIMGPIVGAMAQRYRKEIGRRAHRGLEGRARDGRSTGGRAYGYIAQTASGSGEREVEPEQAAVVRRIFRDYAAGASAKTIAAALNAEGVPSPGATWARTTRRRTGWLASAIAGDPVRGTGILNNELYRGRVIWNRNKWIRSAVDSKRRRPAQRPRADWIEHQEEGLRIVSEELWQAVKARQRRQAETIGARVKAGLSRRKAASGRAPQHLFSGWLVCGCCGARFTLVNRRSYGCASYVNGRACTNKLTVRRDLVESRLLEGIREALSAEDVAREVEKRLRALLATRRQKPSGKRMTELRAQVDNLVAAIATGGLQASPALGRKLREVEADLERLAHQEATSAQPARLVPDVRVRFRALLDRLPERLATHPERARAALQEVLGDEITLRPAAAGGYLEAEFGIQTLPLAAASGMSESLVAGAGFEPATFGL